MATDRAGRKRSSKRSGTSKKNINIKKTVIIAVVCIAVLYFSVTFIKQQITINQKNRELDEIKKKVEEATAQSERLNQELDKFNDPEYIERKARNELGMVRPNERVFVDSNKSSENNGSGK